MSDLRYRMSFFTATPCCPNHPGTPSHAVGVWAKPFDLCAHTVGLASGKQSWEILFSCSSNPEKVAIAARHAEGQWTNEVCRPPQWVSDSLTVWIWVQQVIYLWPCKGLEEGLLALAALQTQRKRWWRDLVEARWGCRLAPMDSQGVREVVCAQHCP
jgi:hypothetical protein